jgi:hypothetical protein
MRNLVFLFSAFGVSWFCGDLEWVYADSDPTWHAIVARHSPPAAGARIHAPVKATPYRSLHSPTPNFAKSINIKIQTNAENKKFGASVPVSF